jgi:hypothetical protein
MGEDRRLNVARSWLALEAGLALGASSRSERVFALGAARSDKFASPPNPLAQNYHPIS